MKSWIFFGVCAGTMMLGMATLSAEDAQVGQEHYALRVHPETGDLVSFTAFGRELIHDCGKPRALFGIRLRDDNGVATDLSALEASAVTLKRESNPDEDRIIIGYEQLRNLPVSATVTIRCPKSGTMTYWHIATRNETGQRLEHIDFPTVVVPDRLVGQGGDARLFWPAMEGVVVEDISLRESWWWKWRPIEHPSMGWIGLYPSSCPMQFMAYYGPDAGLYLATHDAEGHPKGIEYHYHPDGGIFLDLRHLTNAVPDVAYSLPYEVVLGGFRGDWYDAAEIYRDWLEHSDMPAPPRFEDNPAVPAWYAESPVVIGYPVRGTKDLGDMTPNEYYPYTNALPHLFRLAEELDSPVMALLMHWEGSAPWAPPYVWPPYGDAEDFKRFIATLHEKGHLAGLYASGTGYTIRSNTDPSYDMSREFEEKRLVDIVVRDPEGKPAENGVCCGPQAQRIGYDMCPANEWVKDVVVREVAKILPSGVDYLQYFDQNLGGSCYRCYAKTHGHPPGPGLWQNQAMSDLYRRIQECLRRAGSRTVIGCEGAAGEPFRPYLLMNDNRNYLNLHAGTPVPAYAFVNHEYVVNFMGNQNATHVFVDIKRSPLNLHQRVAMSFVAGDLLTGILKGGGKLCWEWSGDWDAEGPDHDAVITLMRNLNAWRRFGGKPYLAWGRMLKPFSVEGTRDIPFITPRDQRISMPSLLTSRWLHGGRTAQFLVNYTDTPQEVRVVIPGEYREGLKLAREPRGTATPARAADDGRLPVTVPPLSAVMLEAPAR
ncbi:MAG TPA: DUF6259 domain-containing protein [Candidatus Hydrogenedentes bacterium]|nr:DUF6259 domain-containing protein [Candidatus Hydrogenedentota bacterium]